MNSLFQQLNKGQISLNNSPKLPSSISNLKNLFNSNPQSFIQNMIAKNPQLKNTIDMLNASKMSPKDFFYQYAKQNGVDPDQFIDSLK